MKRRPSTAPGRRCTCGKGCWCRDRRGVPFAVGGEVGCGHVPRAESVLGPGGYDVERGYKVTTRSHIAACRFGKAVLPEAKESWMPVSYMRECKARPLSGAFSRAKRKAVMYFTGGDLSLTDLASTRLSVESPDPCSYTRSDSFTKLEHQFSRAPRMPRTSQIFTDLNPAKKCDCHPFAPGWSRSQAVTCDPDLPKYAVNPVRL